MDTPSDPTLQRLQSKLSTASWERRITEARRQADLLDRIVALVAEGRSIASAIAEVVPGAPDATWRQRLKRYREGGEEALINRRLVQVPEKVTPDVVGMVRGLLIGNPELRSEQLCDQVEQSLGVRLGGSTMRQLLQAEGLQRPRGRPARRTKAEAHPIAGAELLVAADIELGAVARLTADIEAALDLLPDPEGPVKDDRAHRDAHGRFTSEYNADQARGEAMVGPRFESVESHREGKDLTATRTANSSTQNLHRKNLALTMLPCVTDGARLQSLRHWQGGHLGPLVGYAYQPSTLEKYLRELKLSGVSDVAQESVARTWLTAEGPVADPDTGAVVVYGDTSTKPIWTQHFMRSTPVSKQGGRVMPANSTMYLHSGCGTPLLYRAFSGTASLPREIPSMLRDYELVAGKDTARRMVVLDRESHAVWLFKELAANDWLYIVPLRQSVTGPNARFKDVGEWIPYGDAGDAVQDGRIWLNDSRKGEKGLWVRAIARRRHRSGKIAWFATNSDPDEFSANKVIDLYFARWPLQEHVFRNANGRVGLGKHHGYGRKLIDNVTVLDGIEKLDGKIRKLEAEKATAREAARRQAKEADVQRHAVTKVQERAAELSRQVDHDVETEQTGTDEFRERYQELRALEEWLTPATRTVQELLDGKQKQENKAQSAADKRTLAETRRTTLSGRTRIFTVDVELDQLMTAYKITFLNLCAWLLANYFGGAKMELDTLIKSILTLPGERVITPRTEIIRIYRHSRDPKVMAMVDKACKLLTARRLTRNKRRLRYELVQPPAT